jgi:biopolymer transport protein ExbD
MSLNRIAAPLTSLLLTLVACAVMLLSTSYGFTLDLAKAVDCGEDDRRTVIVILHRDHSVAINQDAVEREMLPHRLADIFKTTYYRIVYVQADEDVSYNDFVALVDAIRPVVGVISLVTPSLQKPGTNRCIVLGCPDCLDRRSPTPLP